MLNVVAKKKTSIFPDKKKADEIRRKISLISNALNISEPKYKAFKNCGFLRYLLTLYWGMHEPLEYPHAEVFSKKPYHNRYQLFHTAKKLDLKYQRGRTPKRVFEKFKQKNEVLIRKRNGIHYALTERGMKQCDDRMDTVLEIMTALCTAEREMGGPLRGGGRYKLVLKPRLRKKLERLESLME